MDYVCRASEASRCGVPGARGAEAIGNWNGIGRALAPLLEVTKVQAGAALAETAMDAG